MKKAVTIFCICAAVCMLTCSKDGNPSGPGGGSADNTMTVNYSISSNMITISIPAQTYTYHYCNGDSLKTETNTDTAQTQTTPYLLLNSDNLLVITDQNGLDSLTRVGTGMGVQGQWTGSDGASYNVGVSTITMTIVNNYYADDFIMSWNVGGQTSHITVTKVSDFQVTLKGNMTQELVTVTFNSAGDATYTSSNTANTAKVVYSDPASCPNDPPTWLTTFKTANLSAIAKTAVAAPAITSRGFLSLLAKRPHFSR